MPQRGKLIVVYGMNNLGKTTQVKRLCQHFQGQGLDVRYLKYPIYTLPPTGPLLNGYLRKGQLRHLTPFQIQELYTQNRRDFQPTLEELLEQGVHVCAEDYTGTGLAWGTIFGADKQALLGLNGGLLAPDLEILFDGERFTSGREAGHAHEDRSQEEWQRGRAVHLELAREFGWRIVQANGTYEEVTTRLVEAVRGMVPVGEAVVRRERGY